MWTAVGSVPTCWWNCLGVSWAVKATGADTTDGYKITRTQKISVLLRVVQEPHCQNQRTTTGGDQPAGQGRRSEVKAVDSSEVSRSSQSNSGLSPEKRWQGTLCYHPDPCDLEHCCQMRPFPKQSRTIVDSR
ncbi:hypothetical protein KQX54_003331 [Cotesia glomerata]|uniref:Secreted protein n=1 Tax=Cotesia glomerata TaxID=32391 RepID=A0AAV7J5T8_COTGL|nr:hypothetical protein KQX54_003331 [Cotesia glomerata]